MGLLNKTKTYLVGHMQYADGQEWRGLVKHRLETIGIQIFNPYDKPFIKDVDEGNSVRAKLQEKLHSEDYDYVQEKMREIRIFDLNLVDRSDFIIAHIIPKIASWGSAEELVTAVRCKKPVFLSVEGGKKACPQWIFGMFPHKYIYNNIDEVLDTIVKIDSGEISINNDRWRLLKECYR